MKISKTYFYSKINFKTSQCPHTRKKTTKTSITKPKTPPNHPKITLHPLKPTFSKTSKIQKYSQSKQRYPKLISYLNLLLNSKIKKNYKEEPAEVKNT